MFERAISIEPNFALAHASLSYLCALMHVWYEHDGRWSDRSIVSLERALSLEPQLAEALVAQAMLLWGQSKYDDSIQITKTVVAMKPSCDGAYWVLGAGLFSSDRWSEAADLAETAIEMAGDDYNVYIPYKNCAEKAGRKEEYQRIGKQFIRSLQQQLEWVPEDARAHVLLGGQYAAAGDEKNAIREVEEALVLRPNDNNILYNSACTYGRLNMPKESLEILKRSVNIGYGMMDWMQRDPDLACLHDDPEFQKLFEPKKPSA
jgi:adenylate cyclase